MCVYICIYINYIQYIYIYNTITFLNKIMMTKIHFMCMYFICILFIYIYIHIYIYTYTHIHIHIYTYTYIYIYISAVNR